MSFLGTLEQLNLALLLQRIEEYRRTGMLAIRQDGQGIEFYFRDGRLLCIGPVRSGTTLGDRLVKANVISPEILRETLAASGESAASETHLALVLMELGHVTRDDLRSWAAREAASVIQAVCAWQKGDVYLEEGVQPAADRLLISLPVASLLPQPPSAEPAAPARPDTPQLSAAAQTAMPESFVQQSPAPVRAAEFITETPRIAFGSDGTQAPEQAESGMISTTITPPQALPSAVPYPTVDTTFLRPEMALFPADTELLQQQQALVPITPEQWRVLTRVNGQTTLGEMCQELYMSVEVVRRVVGELLAMRLVSISVVQHTFSPQGPLPTAAQPAETRAVPHPADPLQSSPLMNAQPYGFTAPLAFAAESQWGNGDNGSIFVPGHGWVTRSQPLQPLSGTLYPAQQVYAGIHANR